MNRIEFIKRSSLGALALALAPRLIASKESGADRLDRLLALGYPITGEAFQLHRTVKIPVNGMHISYCTFNILHQDQWFDYSDTTLGEVYFSHNTVYQDGDWRAWTNWETLKA